MTDIDTAAIGAKWPIADDCEWCVDGIQADGETPCPCQEDRALRDQVRALCVALDEARAKNERLGRDLNMAKYGKPDFAWSIHLGVMADLRAENERLRAFIEDFASTDFEQVRPSNPPRHPADELDPVTDWLHVVTWQEDARAALAQKGGA